MKFFFLYFLVVIQKLASRRPGSMLCRDEGPPARQAPTRAGLQYCIVRYDRYGWFWLTAAHQRQKLNILGRLL